MRFLLCVLLFFSAALPAYAQSEPEELILAVQAGRYNLSSGLLAYEHNNHYYLPVLALSSAFEFHAEGDFSMRRVTGWALEEERSFQIDVLNNKMQVRGKDETLAQNMVLPEAVTGAGDFYVRMDVLNRLWPVALTVNKANLSLDVLVDGTLPFVQKAERKKRQNALSVFRQKGQKEKALTPLANPYRIYGLPVLDIETQHSYDESRDAFDGRLAVTGVQDLLWMSANYSAVTQYQDGRMEAPDALRLRFDRDATLTEPLPFDLQHIELGDTRLRHAPLIKNNTGGRGFLMSSSKRKRDGTFDVTTIEGTGPQGWDVELYRNDSLIEFSTINERGEYRFENVELNFGNNIIRVVLYGPQGQMREVAENYSFGANMLRPGQFNYTLGVLDAEKDLIPIDQKRHDVLNGAAASGEIAYGINRFITGYATLSSLPTDQDRLRRDFLSVGTAITMPIGALQIEGYQDVSQDSAGRARGNALDARFITDVNGFKFNIRNALFNKFESPEAGYGDTALTRQTEIGIQKNIPFAFGMLGLNLDYKNNQRRDNSRFSTIGTRQSFSYNGLRLTHVTTSYLGDNHHQTSGQLTATARIKKWRLRSAVNYDAVPDSRLRGFDGEIFYRASDKLSGSLLARHDFQEEDSGTGLQLNYDFDKFIGSVETLWGEKSGAQIMLRASTALGPYANDGGYMMTSDRLTGASAVRARVFMDRNNDGRYDEGDVPVQEARVKVNSRNPEKRSDQNGWLVNIAGSGVENAAVELDHASLEDPYQLPVGEGFMATLRPGSLPQFDFPVIETGAVDGSVYAPGGKPGQGLKLELVDAHDVVLQETETAYDGFYSFEYVPPGSYRVRSAASEKVTLTPRTVQVSTGSLFASGVNLAYAGEGEEQAEAAVQIAALPEKDAQPEIAPAIVQKVEVMENENSVRLTLNISGPVLYTVQRSENGRTIFVDLPQVHWQALRAWRGSSDAVLAAYDIEPLKEGGTRLKLAGQRSMSMVGEDQEPRIAPDNRLSFDLTRD